MATPFRPWCPKCDETSPAGSLNCARCGLRLYPKGYKPPPVPSVHLVDDDEHQAEVEPDELGEAAA